MKTILIADDSEQGREFLRSVLEHAGYRVLEAANGQELLDLAKTVTPALVILDLQMPVMDGYQTVAELRKNAAYASTPIIAFSAYAMERDRERAIAAGFTNYLSKPIRIAVLREEIARWTGGPS